jgi:hypothetical protein
MVALVPKDPARILNCSGETKRFRWDVRCARRDSRFHTIVAVEGCLGAGVVTAERPRAICPNGKNVTVDEMMHGTFHLPDPVEVQPH